MQLCPSPIGFQKTSILVFLLPRTVCFRKWRRELGQLRVLFGLLVFSFANWDSFQPTSLQVKRLPREDCCQQVHMHQTWGALLPFTLSRRKRPSSDSHEGSSQEFAVTVRRNELLHWTITRVHGQEKREENWKERKEARRILFQRRKVQDQCSSSWKQSVRSLKCLVAKITRHVWW